MGNQTGRGRPMRALLLILTCLLMSACSAQKVAEQMAQQNRPDPAASAQMAQQKQIKDMESMQRRAEYDREQQRQKAYLRPGLGQPLPPPPPDPANTQAFVPPAMDIKGTPAALAAPDAQAIIEKAYEDFDYAYLTRDISKCMAIAGDVLVVDGEKLDKAGQRKYWQEEFQAINDLEAKVGQTLRVGSSTEILKLTPKAPDRVALQVRSINRLMATSIDFQDVITTESREVWVLRSGAWKLTEVTIQKEDRKTYRDGQEIEL